MVHKIQLDNELDIKEVSKETSREKVNIINHYGNNVESRRYMPSVEFRKRAIEKVNKFCDKHGIL
jgi:histidinol phosphatase-like PHP family hydrolase